MALIPSAASQLAPAAAAPTPQTSPNGVSPMQAQPPTIGSSAATAYGAASVETPRSRHESGVRAVVARHREWFRSELEQMLTGAERLDPENSAAQLVLLRDAAMVGGYLDGWERVRPAFLEAAHRAAGISPQ